MTPLSQSPLSNQSFNGRWEERDSDYVVLPAAFDNSINKRDKFLGQKRCVVCGLDSDMVLQHCHIFWEQSMWEENELWEENETWSDLQNHGWIPFQTRLDPRHEPRNGLLLCSNHRIWFDNYHYFLRFSPNLQKFIFVNYSGDPELQKYHGKAIALDAKDCDAPFPSLFLLQEMRVRAFRPFSPLNPSMPNDSPWQEWIVSDGVFDHVSGSFKRDNLPDNSSNGSISVPPQRQLLPAMTNASGVSSGDLPLEPLNMDVIAEIVNATRAMPSWKACVKACEEGSSWTGTAEENIQKYFSSSDNTQRASSTFDL